MTADTIIRNANATLHPSHVAAAAAQLVGINAQSLCCWCADHVKGGAYRLHNARGECSRCPETGRDVLLVFPD